jgi:16S rRNA (uracil1498-N3)-methyltransferase
MSARTLSRAVRLFVQSPLAEAAVVQLSTAQTHHLASVMRRQPGDSVLLFNGYDGEWLGRIRTIARSHRATVSVEAQMHKQKPEPDLWLLFAHLKRDATNLVVEKATELGVNALLPVVTERTVAPQRANVERLTAIAIEAAEQSERLSVPLIHSLQPLPVVLATWPHARRLYVALERAPVPRLGLGGLLRAEPAALLVGPEGGFTPGEVDLICAQPFTCPVSLGERILRAETACLAGLALLQAY